MATLQDAQDSGIARDKLEVMRDISRILFPPPSTADRRGSSDRPDIAGTSTGIEAGAGAQEDAQPEGGLTMSQLEAVYSLFKHESIDPVALAVSPLLPPTARCRAR